eukprot:CAMPEP_0175074526 /NCGR_PEP_ID=MMETSP0052_2-20121109/21371_1 /TAXON_ID=51329 ORGANISM="Polytomella parva, Strain SAG 63-3" /NCGR_SAMPLE_ID=MMETSP0052_2 /ASSEMBLY_ACC=CAM_ASM_000194 /LENGTH=865 /DNA_ID=CAMNT_0016342865 /DNA_START=39 /DNA_END=2639 /DNA_ORIENTATION=+
MADQRLPRATRVKNKQASDRQITAEQILREARESQLEDGFKAPKAFITAPEELNEYRLAKRKEFEDNIRRVGRFNAGIWIKYATWEEQQKDFRRSRSVWERALQIDYRNVSTWLKYAEMEMRHRFVNHARNVWDRAVALLPRVDQLWYKYVHMEEMLGNVAGARQIFERWMNFEPDHQGWMAYVRFETRYEEWERARTIFERYVKTLPTVKAWVRYAKFEMSHGDVARARGCYERAAEELGEDAQTEEFYLRFAEFEELVDEPDRARAIFKFALDHIPRHAATSLHARFVQFEKQHGSRSEIEDVVIGKRRFQYEEALLKNPLDYDLWFDLTKLEESAAAAATSVAVANSSTSSDTSAVPASVHARVRETYERAVAAFPPANEKRFWRRYIYLWIKYALYEELQAKDLDRTRAVYRAALEVIPHRYFTFAKIWILAAKFEIRARDVTAARKLLGRAIGMCPKDRLFRGYIELELAMGQVDRCRTLYQKYLEWNPSNATAWIRFAELESTLGEAERARAVFELSTSQPLMDMPETLWKAYIDFEISEGDRQRVRLLYLRLLDRTKHVKVWLSFASFEATPLAGLEEALEEAVKEEEGGEKGDENGHEEDERSDGEDCGTKEKEKEKEKEGKIGFSASGEEIALDEEEEEEENEEEESKKVKVKNDDSNSDPSKEVNQECLRRKQSKQEKNSTGKRRIIFNANLAATDSTAASADEEVVFSGSFIASSNTSQPSAAGVAAATKNLAGEDMGARARCARAVYRRAFRTLRESLPDAKEEAVMLLETWQNFERGLPWATMEDRQSGVDAVAKKMPKRVKKRKPVIAEDGKQVGMEEYYDYIFPEESAAAPGLKLLEAAYRWKRKRQEDE